MHGLRKRQKKPGKREIRSISLKKQTEKNKKQKTGLTKEEKKRLKELRMIKAENQKKRKPFTAQDTIPYKEIYKDGICRTDDNYYSKMVQFYDINYQLAQNDDKAAIFENYCEFLNSFDSSVEVQITFLNQQVNFDEYAKNIDIPEQDDCFNDIRKEYSDMLKMQLSKGNNGLVKTKYITFSIKADNLRNAKSRLERIEASVLNNFKVMGAMAEPLNGVERLKILHDVMNMDTKESFHFHYGMVAKTGLQTKDFIAPTGFDFRNDSYFRMGQTFGCVSYLQITSPELTDKLLADLLDLEENLIINMHLRPIDPKAAIKSLKSTLSNIQKMKIEEQKKAVRSGYDMDIIPTDISTYGEDVEGLLNEIQSRNEKLFELTFLLMNTADNKRKLDNIVYQTAGIAQKYNCNIRRLQYQQEQGIVASLPLGMNQTGIQRIMTTTSTAIFVPFTTQELFQGGEALYYGLNALSNNLIMVDRKRLKTPNGLILGTPGSGKSFATKREILNVFLITDDDIMKKPQNAELNGDEVSMIDLCVKDIYKKYLYNDPKPENMPTLQDFYERLNFYAPDKPAAQNIANSLQLYVTGSQNVFNHRSNVDTQNRVVCFDIRELGTTLRKAGMLIVQHMVWTRVSQNRSRRKSTRYYVDEFHLLLNQPQTANYSIEMWKRFRKWGGIITGISQNVTDFLGSLAVESIVGNSDFILMLNQHSGDQKILAEKLNISKHQISFVNNSNAGEGLLFYGNVIIPFADRYPQDTRTYALMSTKPDEIQT